jgi:hypothetical protein
LDDQARYSVFLGVTRASGLPKDLFASGEPRWLGVQAQLPGEEEQPRVLLVSVPYALKAADADTIGGKPASAFVLAPTEDQSPKSTGVRPQFTGAGTGTSTQNRTIRWTDTAGTLGDGSIQDNNASGVAVTIGSSGNVGINQTSPGAKLQVNSSAQTIDGIWTAGSDSHFLRMSPSLPAANYNAIVQAGDATLIYSNGNINTGALVLAPWASGTAGIRMDNNGNVGINQTNPGAKLQVNSSAQSTDGIWTASSDSHFLRFSPSLGPGYYNPIVQAGDSALIYSRGSVATGALVLAPWANGASGIRMDNNGNVGIGTTTPGAKLDVAGDLKVEGHILGGALNLNSGGVLQINGTPFLQNSGTDNTFVGANAGNSSVTGAENTANGFQALMNNSVGYQNTAAGSLALQNNTTGFDNTATGESALFSNSTGNFNTAAGEAALYHNTSGYGNTGGGASALGNNTTGSYNAAVGGAALFNNTTGSSNTALGYYAGVTGNAANTNTTGSDNTFIGFQAGPGTPTQLTNATAIGANALVSASNTLVLGAPGVSVVIGAATAGYTLDVEGGKINASGGLCINGNCQTTWPMGTITAVNAGTGLTGGGTSGSVTLNISNGGIGTTQLADASVTSAKIGPGTIVDANISASASISPAKIAGTAATLGVNTFVGTQTITSGGIGLPNTTNSNTGVLRIGGVPFLHDFGGVTGFPGFLGPNTFVGNSAGNFTMTGNAANVGAGYQALQANSTGSGNTAIGAYAGVTGNAANANTSGSNNTFIGFQAGPGTSAPLTNATAIGSNALVSASNTLVLGAPGVTVAIGVSTAATTLQVAGDIRVGTSGTNGCIQGFGGTALAGTCSSDIRLKQNVEPFEPLLEQLVQLQPVFYEWNAAEHPEYHFGSERTAGLIAQDVEKVFPNMVAVDEHGYKAVNYSQLPLLLLEAVRELKAEVDALKARKP